MFYFYISSSEHFQSTLKFQIKLNAFMLLTPPCK